MTTQEEKLCSRSWRLRNSIWLLWPALSGGTLTSIGLLINGIRTKQRVWFLWAGVYGVWTITYFVSTSFVDMGTKQHPSHTVGSNVVSVTLAILWVVGMVHCFFLNRRWLRWRAANPKGKTAWYASGAAPAPAAGPAPQPADAPADTLSRLYRGAATDPSTQTTTPVDLNSAGADELAGIGIDRMWADRIVAARTRLGGFHAADQVMTEAGVPPHLYATIRGRVQVNPSPAAPQAAPPRGGRRLDF